jgi:hypothetical protein
VSRVARSPAQDARASARAHVCERPLASRWQVAVFLSQGDGILLKRQIDRLMMPTVPCMTLRDDSLQTVGAKMKTLVRLVHYLGRLIRPAPAHITLSRPAARRNFYASLQPVRVSAQRPQRLRLPHDFSYRGNEERQSDYRSVQTCDEKGDGNAGTVRNGPTAVATKTEAGRE